MFVCTNCGFTRKKVSEDSKFVLRRDSGARCERCIVCKMDMCSKCNDRSFFIKTNESEMSEKPSGLPLRAERTGNGLDNDNEQTSLEKLSQLEKESQEYKLRHLESDSHHIGNRRRSQSEQRQNRNTSGNTIHQRRATSAIPLHLSSQLQLQEYNHCVQSLKALAAQPSKSLRRSLVMNQSKPLHKLEKNNANIDEQPSSSRQATIKRKTVGTTGLQADYRGLTDAEQRTLERNVLDTDVQQGTSRTTVEYTSGDTSSEIDDNELPTARRKSQYALDAPRVKEPAELKRLKFATERYKSPTCKVEEPRKVGGSFGRNSRMITNTLFEGSSESSHSAMDLTLQHEIGGSEDQLLEKERELEDLRSIKKQIEREYDRTKMEVRELQSLQQRQQHWKAMQTLKRERSRGGHAGFIDKLECKPKSNKILDTLDDKYNCLMQTLQETNQTKDYESGNTIKHVSFEPTAPPISENETEDLDKEPSKLNVDDRLVILTKMAAKEKIKVVDKPFYDASYSCIITAEPLIDEPNIISTLVSYAQRADYTGLSFDPKEHVRSSKLGCVTFNKPPQAQFKDIPYLIKDLFIVASKKLHALQRPAARPLNISRAPIHCPDTACSKISFISDFNKHLLLDHRSITMERISPRETKSFYLDIQCTLLNVAKCHMLYLLKDKIIDAQSSEMADLLPIMIMTARVQMLDMLALQQTIKKKLHNENTEMFLIWMTCPVPNDMRINGTIAVWPTKQELIPGSLRVHSCDAYDVRAPQDLSEIFHNRSSLIISGHSINLMTNDGEDFLAVQVQIF